MQNWIQNRGDYLDFVGFMIVCAPDFPEEDYLEPEEQLTMEQAYAYLREGLRFFPKAKRDPAHRLAVVALLDQSRAAFESGQILVGTSTFQALDRLLRDG